MSKTRPSEWETLISDYNRDNAYIKSQKRHWLPPRKKQLMAKNPINDQDADDANAADGKVILPKKKTSPSSPSKKNKLSPAMQVMQAVTKAATTPGKKKKNAIPSGPSKANTLARKPQKQARVDKSDGPSAEDDGEA